MATKRISDLQLRSSADATCNVPVDDASQSWRVTLAQIAAYILPDLGVTTAKLADGAVTSIKRLFTVSSVKVAAYTLTAADGVVLASTAGGAFTLTLPAAASVPGRVFEIKKTESGMTNALTVDANASETIDGALTIPIYGKGYLRIVSDGANWIILNQRRTILYTPTLTSVSAITSSTAYESMAVIVDNIMTVSGQFDMNPSTATPAIGISLPVASDFTAVRNANGVAACTSSAIYGSIYGSVAGDYAVAGFNGAGTGVNREYHFIFQAVIQ